MKRVVIILSLLTSIVLAMLPERSTGQEVLPAAYSSSVKLNRIQTWDALSPQTNADTLATRSFKDVKITAAYFDGLGRPLQTVIKRGSMSSGESAKDLVAPVIYDAFGRETFNYLPFVANSTGGNSSISDGLFKLNPFQQDSAFNKGMYSDETYYYSKNVFEPSPLNRVLENYAPGNNWVGTASQSTEANRRGVKMKYWVNRTADSVRIWRVTDVSNNFGTYSADSIYRTGLLYKTVTADEHNKQVIEFKDKEGKIVLKKVQLTADPDTGTGKNHTGWLCTYYIYDDLGQLRCVLQPKAVEAIAGSWSLNSTQLAELCFRYEYDLRGRMIMKKVPGAATVYMIYDARDRLVMTQDSLLRASHKWVYTLYDELNRPTTTGLITDDTYYNNAAYHRGQAETSTSYPNPGSYTNEQLTKTFYDDYSWRSGESNPLSASRSSSYDSYLLTASNTTWPYPQDATSQTARLKGMVTGTKTKVLGSSSDYLYTVPFYDENARTIQVQSTNITGGTDITCIQYSWSGAALISINKQEKAGTNAQTTVALSKITYDDLWRPVKTEKKISTTKVNSASMPGSWTTLSQNEYNALGQLKKKEIGADPLDSLNYEYNIRGWMLGINRSFVKDTTNTDHWFGFDLGYDKTGFTVNSTMLSYTAAQYNGNIGGMLWRSTGDDMLRKYDFTYDAVNRLTGADFNQLNANSFSKAGGIDYSVSGLNYDVNGNILNMNQKGWKLGGSVMIDSLFYLYTTNSNKLLRVSDSIITDNKLGDFNDNANFGDDYIYDGNGNLVLDKNKLLADVSGIIIAPGITYNHLNLPNNILVNTKGSIEYIYDATGNKLKKIVHETGKADKTTLYIAGMVYQDNVLQFASHEEGRARINNDSTAIVYDYMIKDHLGNVRMVLTDEKDTAFYPAATMETANAAVEELLYSYVADTRVDPPLGYPANTPSGNAKVAKVNISETNPFGPAMILKVMAGDKFNVTVNSWWKSTSTPEAPTDILNKLIGSLESSIGSLQGSKFSAAELSTAGVFSPGILSFFSNQNIGGNSSRPWAFLNWILFDEQFNYVSSSSGFDQVGASDTYTTHVQPDLPITKNGFLYIYVSNATDNIPVYFDNLQVTHMKGPLLEETHYYPFGLTMAGISSKAAGKMENKKEKFNGAELNTDFDLNTYEFFYRTYDPQIGRWHNLDTKPTDMVSLYAAMGNNPIRYADPLGDTLALFRPDGTFWKFQDDGKKEFSGMLYQKSTVTSTYEEDGVTYEVKTYSEGKAFEFNDPATDVLGIKNGAITRVEIMSDAQVESHIDKSGVKSPEAQANPVGFANEQGRQGNMDYGVKGLKSADPSTKLNANTFYIRENHAYNVGDIGNYLWGRGIAQLGISLGTASIGAHVNNMVNGRNDHTPLYTFGPGTNGRPGLFDSQADQRAIHRGYANSPKGAMLIKQELQNWPKYNPK